MSYGRIGNLKKRYEEAEVEWEIPDFFSLAENTELFQCSSFCFAETSWNLQLYPKSSKKPGFMSLYLSGEKMTNISLEHAFSLRKMDGSIEYLEKSIVRENSLDSIPCFFKLSEILKRKSDLAHSNMLIVICTMKRITGCLDKSRIMDHPKFTNIIKLDTLSDNFKSLFINKSSCDTTLHVMGKEYKANRVVLMARSSVFASMFLHETTEKQTGIVNISDCEPESFEKFLEYLYCGKLEELSLRDALHLYETSNKYDVQELKISCAEHLMKNLNIENVCDIVVIADKHDDVSLLAASQVFFNENANEIVDSSKWDSLVENNYPLSKKILKEMLSNVKVIR